MVAIEFTWVNEKECDLSTKTCHVPNLQRHHATCGLNYSLLIRLARRFGSEDSLQFILPFGGQDCLVRMRFRDLGPYTGLCESQCSLLRWPEYLGAFARIHCAVVPRYAAC